MFFEMFTNVLNIKSRKPFKYSHPFAMTLQMELRCIQFLLIILEMLLQLDWNPPVAYLIIWT
jgi:hypothetical protein